MKKIVSALLISAAISTPAFAAGFEDGVVGTKYAAVDVGSITYGSLGSATSLSIGGGYQIHPAVAVEVDYLMGGKYSYSVFGVGADYQLSALQVMAVGNYTINDQFSAYGKAGLAFNSQKATVSLFGVSASATQSSNDLTWAIGGKYKINKDIALRLQYQETGVSSVNIISVGATFNF
jgi:OOP family OmpA-OmpF porin